MEFRILARPVAKLAAPRLPLISSRGHKTTARTKRSLKISPHESFLPDRQTPFPASDTIVYNPPSSEASPLHTPFIFLPSNDARRAAITRLRQTPGSPVAPPVESKLPPATRHSHRDPNYNMTAKDVKEMKRLRNEDPVTWTANTLARKFNCSEVFVSMAAPAPAEYLKSLEDKKERREARWGGIRRHAREERARRTEMLYRGEI